MHRCSFINSSLVIEFSPNVFGVKKTRLESLFSIADCLILGCFYTMSVSDRKDGIAIHNSDTLTPSKMNHLMTTSK